MPRVHCPQCAAVIPDAAIRARAGDLAQRARTVRRGGRPPVERPCSKCGDPFGARELREHEPGCRGRRR